MIIMANPNECFDMPGGGRRILRMTEREYQAGVKIVSKRLGVENAFDHPEFVRDIQRLEPHMAVRSLPRNSKIHLNSHIDVPGKGRMTRFGRASFTKVF
jgi:hypothetical protein